MLMAIIITIAISIAYYMGIQKHICPPTQTIIVDKYIYSLDSGKNGIIEFNVDTDSLANVVFVQNQDTFALEGLSREEFQEFTDTLYKK